MKELTAEKAQKILQAFEGYVPTLGRAEIDDERVVFFLDGIHKPVGWINKKGEIASPHYRFACGWKIGLQKYLADYGIETVIK
jgi:hypothetical protein